MDFFVHLFAAATSAAVATFVIFVVPPLLRSFHPLQPMTKEEWRRS